MGHGIAHRARFQNVRGGASLVAAVSIVAVTLGACGGSSEPPTADSTGDAAATASTPAEEANPYLISNREQFLAVDPSCTELEAWYEANPADFDLATAQRFVSKCQDVPAVAMTDASLLEQLTPDVFAAGVSDTHPARKLIRESMVAATCETYDQGEKSPLQVADEVDLRGGDAAEVQAVLESAAQECPEHQAELLVFTVPDISASAEEFSSFVLQSWPQAPGSEAEFQALAAMACGGYLDDEIGKGLVATVTGSGQEDRFVSTAKDMLCP